jgi:hypothetical protein
MDVTTLPASCAVAFKEWSGVCDALADGRQVLILRKGGIAERPGGFAPEHDAFWLYPTGVHQAEQGLRAGSAPTGSGPSPVVEIRSLAVVASVDFVDRLDALEALADEHAWTAETVRKRFEYRRPGLWALAVRVYRRPEPHRLEERPAYAGCKSWVPLVEALPTAGVEPALDDAEFVGRLERLRAKLTTNALRR